MAGTRKKNLIILIIVLMLIVIAAVITLFLFFNSQNQRKLSDILTDTDLALSRGYYQQAENLMEMAMSASSSVDSQLRVLKRAYEYAQNRDNFTQFITLCKKALKSNPGAAKLKNLLFYGLLRSGKTNQLPDHLSKDRHDDLSDLLFMYWHMKTKSILPEDYVPQDEELQELISLLNGKDPTLFLNLGHKYGNNQILKNAALLWAKEGQMQQALEIVKSDLDHIDYDEVSFFIAYDSGDYKEALKRMIRLVTLFPERKDFIILLADLYVFLKDFQASKSFYQNSLSKNPEYSVVPYINLAWIYYQESQFDKAVSLLSEAKDLFPGRGQLIIQIARLLMDNQRQKEAEKILVNSFAQNPDNMDLAIHALDIQRASLSPQDFQNKLWEVIYRTKGSHIIAEYFFAWMFMVNADTADIRRLLEYTEKHMSENEPMGWFFHYKALYLALINHSDEALDILGSLLDEEDHSYIRYNRSLIYFENKDFIKAEMDLQKIISNQINFQPRNNSFYSQVHYRLALVYRELHNLENARKHAQKAMDLYEDYQETYFLLKELKNLP